VIRFLEPADAEPFVALRRMSLQDVPLAFASSPDDDRSVLHRRHRARAIAREIETYGRAQGLVLRELYRDADASAFELGWLWLRERGDGRLLRYLEAGFRTYWSVELDPSDLRAIESLLEEAGCDTQGFDTWCANEGPRLASRIADALGERGLSGAPGYVMEDEFFQGRQHLPMIRWVLGGRQGPGPI